MLWCKIGGVIVCLCVLCFVSTHATVMLQSAWIKWTADNMAPTHAQMSSMLGLWTTVHHTASFAAVILSDVFLEQLLLCTFTLFHIFGQSTISNMVFFGNQFDYPCLRHITSVLMLICIRTWTVSIQYKVNRLTWQIIRLRLYI